MLLIVGLGNPGSSYQNNRHNVGFLFIDYLLEKYKETIKISKFKADAAKFTIDKNEVLLLKPQTFMNNSGLSVIGFKNFFKIDNNNIFVVHDELDIPFGRIKYKKAGGDAGHNGLKDITARISSDYKRIRVGIDHPRNIGLSQNVSNYVLNDFNNNERESLESIFVEVEKLILNNI